MSGDEGSSLNQAQLALLDAPTPETLPELLESLRQIFLIKGTIKPPKETADYSHLPSELQELLKIGSEWSLTGDDIYGFNIAYTSDRETKVGILGDEECLQEWDDDHGPPNVAENEYHFLGGYSEYDYFFVNADPNSPDFGATRLIVNNCNDDDALTTGAFINFLKTADRFSKEFLKDDEGESGVPSLLEIARDFCGGNKRQKREEEEEDDE